MVTAIVGFLISVFYILPNEAFPNNKTWAFTFGLFFLIMFVASVISMSTAPFEAEESLDHTYRKKKRK